MRVRFPHDPFFKKIMQKDFFRKDGRLPFETRIPTLDFVSDVNNGKVIYKKELNTIEVSLLEPLDKSLFKCVIKCAYEDKITGNLLFQYKNKIESIFYEICSVTSCIYLDIFVVNSNNNFLDSLFNSVALCLLYNGVSLSDVPIAVNFSNNIDISCFEQKSSCSGFLVMLYHAKKIMFFEYNGQFLKHEFLEYKRNAIALCDVYFCFFKQELEKLLK